MPEAEAMLEALRGAGMRITRARREICAVLAAAPAEHLAAADIAARLPVPVDTSTVYRTLEVLERVGFVTHVHLGHGAGAYHAASVARHHHLVCETCGAVIDVPAGPLEEAVARITASHGFAADPTHFAIVGRCRACAGANR